jgi:hypothetical protein
VSAKFVMFKMATPNEYSGHILINRDRVLAAHESGTAQVTLVMDREHVKDVEVEGDFKSVWEALMGETVESFTYGK